MLALLALSFVLLPAVDETVTMKLVSKEGMPKVGYYMPVKTDLSASKPDSITKLPADLKAPMYGKLDFAADGKQIFHMVLDEPDGAPARLFVDTNGNGDLTDDPATEWAGKKSEDPDKPFVQYTGSFKVNLGTATEPYEVSLGAYRFDKNDPGRAALKDKILYYRDYVTEGEMKLGDKTYKVLLNDNASRADFRGKQLPENAGDKDTSGVGILIDVNGNGKFDKKGESFDVRKPFNIAGTTYEISDMARNGLSFKVVKSTRIVAEIPVPFVPDHSVGKKITAFNAKDMDGKPVQFPGSYKGKIVLVDFWATWCGPCMKEVPNLVETYEKFHDKGFEVLGVTLDSANAEEKIKTVTGENKMTWRQIFDGKGWGAEIAVLYGVDSIPATYLVDGDTGVILATGGNLRKPKLAATIEAALAKKSQQ
jgi:thiol-disulfide isomerase/thioredoxin